MNEVNPKIFEALEFAAKKHQRQRRKGTAGIPYINHPIEVARMIATEIHPCSDNLLIAALLHDVLEDTDTNSEDLIALFGREVASIVEEVSDDMSLPSALRKDLQVENAHKLTGPARCIRIADKACNIRDLLNTRIKWTRRRKIDYVLWAMKVVDEVRQTNSSLESVFDQIVEDAAFRLDYPFQ